MPAHSASPRIFYGHTDKARPRAEWQLLEDHLQAVARLAEGFAGAFESAAWGRLAGLWHDLGKYQIAFQDYVEGRDIARVDHSSPGALLAERRSAALPPSQKFAFLPLAFAIAGHHAGLANKTLARSKQPTPLTERLKVQRANLEATLLTTPADLAAEPLPVLPLRFQLKEKPGKAAQEDFLSQLELWTRFLFSALVDADYLDTEAFYRGEERSRAMQGFLGVEALLARLDARLATLTAGADDTAVNHLRAEVLAACRVAAARPPGIFSLSVPTGGGKTLSSLAFALEHARRHGLRRVITVIPFTTILEQNAAVLKTALGDEQVIEHHSNLDPEKETPRNRLTSENWDAPVIVTTGVQLFESLFANRPSRCRKLHNVAKSVLILDEAQTLPPTLLTPILDGLHQLVAHYGCTVLLSTATQPALRQRKGLPGGFEAVEEIVPDPAELARRLQRYRVEWRVSKPVTWAELAAEAATLPRVLLVTHRRQDARDLFRLLPKEGRYHLSALMCAAHRSKVLAKIRQALDENRTCRLVSTQLIEAGVDVDFPRVYRALGGLDSLIQAGGRANREGGLAEGGLLVIYRAPTDPPPGIPSHGLETMEMLLNYYGGAVDLEAPAVVEKYFEWLYQKVNLDLNEIQGERRGLNFATVAQRFRMIEDDWSEPLLVPYKDARERLDRYRQDPNRRTLRALQPYLVNVPRHKLEELKSQGAIEPPVHDTVHALFETFAHLYDEDELGLQLDDVPNPDPAALVV